MLIMRHRFSDLVAERVANGEQEQSDRERDAMTVAHSAALRLISTHLQVAQKGLMTYYGVHVIHQLTQAGRTLVGFLLNCQSDTLRPLIALALDSLRSCVGLLRRFSSRYVCGQRSCDMLEEFCRLTQIPLDNLTISSELMGSSERPPWIRPARKKNASTHRSTGAVGSPPHNTPESTGNLSCAPACTPLDLVTDSAPVAPSQCQQEFSVGTASPSEQFPNPAGGLELPMPSAELMAFLGDGCVDVFGLFLQSALPEFATDRLSRAPHGDVLPRCGSQEADKVAGLVE